MALIKALLTQWYLTLSHVSAALTVTVSDLADRVALPALTVLLFGLVGAVAPCQLTTNLSAMAYVGSRLGQARPWREALAYASGKVLMYTLAGAAVVVVGLQLQAAAVPVVVAARKALGPLMVVIGLGFVGVLRFRGSMGRGVAGGFVARLARSHRLVSRIAGAIFIVAGLHDTLTYWVL